MLKNIIKYLCLVLFLNVYQHQLYGMQVCSDLPAPQNRVEQPSRDLNQDLLQLGRWIADSPLFTSIALASIAYSGGLTAAASVSSAFLAHKGLSKIPTQPDVTAAKVASKELLKEGKDTMVYLNTTMKSGTELIRALRRTAKTIKGPENPNPEFIGFDIRNARNDIEFKQSINKFKEIRLLVNDVDECLQNAPHAFESLRSFAREWNKDNGFKPTTLADIRELHNQNIASTSQKVQITSNIAATTDNLARTALSAAQIANITQQILSSPNYEHKVTHTKNTITRTFASIASISVGGLLLYKHLANHVDHKSTILASIGAGLITVPWITSYIDR